jgi:hypothetical protein
MCSYKSSGTSIELNFSTSSVTEIMANLFLIDKVKLMDKKDQAESKTENLV